MAALTKVILALLLVVGGGGAASSGDVGQRDDPGQSAGAVAHVRPTLPTEARRTFRERPSGEWVATGRVLTADHALGRSVGEVLKRRWRFETECAGGACRMYFLRTSSTGVQSSLLRLHRGIYLGGFDRLPSDCEVRPGLFATYGVNFSIWWSKDRSHLIAEEMGGFFDDPRCGDAGERIRWTARRRYGGHSEGSDEVL